MLSAPQSSRLLRPPPPSAASASADVVQPVGVVLGVARLPLPPPGAPTAASLSSSESEEESEDNEEEEDLAFLQAHAAERNSYSFGRFGCSGGWTCGRLCVSVVFLGLVGMILWQGSALREARRNNATLTKQLRTRTLTAAQLRDTVDDDASTSTAAVAASASSHASPSAASGLRYDRRSGVDRLPPVALSPAELSLLSPYNDYLGKAHSLTHADERWLLQKWKSTWGLNSSHTLEGRTWAYWPPYPFQRRTLVPSSLSVFVLRRVEFVIQGRDIFGRAVRRGGDFFSVVAEGVEAKTRRVKWRMYPEDMGDGSYRVSSIAPPTPGRYRILTSLVQVDESAARCDVNLYPSFCRFNQDCAHGHHPDWPGWIDWLMQNQSMNVVMQPLELSLITNLTVMPVEAAVDPASVPPAAALPFRDRPPCPDASARLGWVVADLWFPFECNVRYDPAFLDPCLARLKGKTVGIIGSSLERYMLEFLGDQGVHLPHIGCWSDPPDRVPQCFREHLAKPYDILWVELVLHEVMLGCGQYRDVTLPIVEHLIDDAFLRPNAHESHRVNQHNPHYNRDAPALPPSPVKQIIWATGSYVQSTWQGAHYNDNLMRISLTPGRNARVNALTRAWAVSKGFPILDRFHHYGPRYVDSKDNVHYEWEVYWTDWVLFLSVACSDTLTTHTEGITRTHEYKKLPFSGVEGFE